MGANKQTEYERILVEAGKLGGQTRRQYLAQACGDDTELCAAIEAGLAVVDGSSSAKASPSFQEERRWWERVVSTRVRRRIERAQDLFLSPIGVVLLVALLVVTGLWTSQAVEEGLEDAALVTLEALLENELEAVENWIDVRFGSARYIAGQPRMRVQVDSLLERIDANGASPEELGAAPELASVREVQEPRMDSLDFRGFLILAPSGKVVMADRDRFLGRHLSLQGAALVERAFQGETLLRICVDANELFLESDPADDDLLVFVATPIYAPGSEGGEERVSAVMADRLDPRNSLRVILAGDLDKRLDTIAFDETGMLLSDTVYAPILRAAGELAEGRPANLLVPVRDPGGDLTAGFVPEVPPAGRPLTRMAARATQGESGFDFSGYRNLAGVDVIGVWAWVPEHGFGLAVEMERGYLIRMLRPLRLAFQGLVLLVVLGALVVMSFSYTVKAARRRERELILGRYRLVREIGSGGMGTVYEARHSMLRRRTAVKILKPDVLDTETLARFEREVQLTSQLSHPNTLEIYDYGKSDQGVFYYAMEYIDGITLADLLEREGALPVGRAIHVLRQVCGSLAEAHDVGLIHRDIKPLNIMLCRRGGLADVVKVLDFGLVKPVGKDTDTHLTARDVVTGTPLYVAPERVLDPDNVDTQSDLYSVGAVAFGLLTGREPFEGKSSAEVLDQVLRTAAPAPSTCTDQRVPPELDRIVLELLAKDPAERPESILAVRAVLDSLALEWPWSDADAEAWWDTFEGGKAPGAPVPDTEL